MQTSTRGIVARPAPTLARMPGHDRSERLRSFLLGGVLGASAALAAVRRRARKQRRTPPGLAAFEDAPCYQELVDGEERVRAGRRP